MAAEFAVLAGDHGADHVAVDLADRHPVALGAAPGEHVAEHRRGDRRIDEPIGDNPQERSDKEDQDELEKERRDAPGQRPRPPALVAGNGRRRALGHRAAISAPDAGRRGGTPGLLPAGSGTGLEFQCEANRGIARSA